ncbi:MAG TPA: hypothetical protein VFV38_52865 [Ktedonobacteraceae bacterium]|nr:hypothetical protein [Ktedonobacteraceae bacterium]
MFCRMHEPASHPKRLDQPGVIARGLLVRGNGTLVEKFGQREEENMSHFDLLWLLISLFN